MLSLLCIEPPISLSDADSIRDEKVKVLRSVKRIAVSEVAQNTVRARYKKGFIDGVEVPGYLEEKDVPPGSMTETFVAMKLEIDNWRWAGVPIYIRNGKRLPRRVTELTVHFKKAPGSLFRGRQVMDLEQNSLVIQVQPDESISFRINSKPPGPRLRVRSVNMDFEYTDSFGVASAEAYERLILDAMKGDATLFIRDDEVEEAWNLLAPVFEAWSSKDGPPLYEYEAGTWGPSAAAGLLRPGGHRWRRL
jgi:glucose-6-phosphate 1-dehydrogenase